ncbi:phosphatase PAP2 family protein [Bradyrhizobium elkanii]|uniref:phosphatase PAP2 family protein n=1 Tax=Bradyrhizobium elkanii TaxID=29448 RepID=UPI001FDA62D7|nr:phosphatase PAP2 family protein [Bradyrhizobium elkanii]MBP2428843.1 membrane-associated phospholipid phosphatase [Bradyrhizobium elkanii]WLA93608.1 hypothetical protein QNJ96_10175 [Bradyrhizobium elkanii]
MIGHVHGIPLSGKRKDAFPSGHALHMGALASAPSALSAGLRRAIRVIAVGLTLTRIVILADWASDVVAELVGLGCGKRSHRRPDPCRKPLQSNAPASV